MVTLVWSIANEKGHCTSAQGNCGTTQTLHQEPSAPPQICFHSSVWGAWSLHTPVWYRAVLILLTAVLLPKWINPHNSMQHQQWTKRKNKNTWRCTEKIHIIGSFTKTALCPTGWWFVPGLGTVVVSPVSKANEVKLWQQNAGPRRPIAAAHSLFVLGRPSCWETLFFYRYGDF